MSSQCGIRVICRFRPINNRERQEQEKDPDKWDLDCIQYPSEQTVEVRDAIRGKYTFNYDRVFQPGSTQQEVYDDAAFRTINDVLEGFNGTIFAYGQTGAGKSFTMFGVKNTDDMELKGIIPRSSRHIFRTIETDEEETEYTVKCSFLEIYQEKINDLFNEENRDLQVRESPQKGIYVQGLTEEFVASEEDIFALLEIGEKMRAVSGTDMNAESSRSHSLFMIHVHQKHRDGSTKMGKLNLVDLAGSEKLKKTNAQGQTKEEAKKINSSLTCLGNCIKALTTRSKHVPFRDSKLTRILQESLGGNTKTTLMVACSPHPFNLEETLSTLRFAQRAKTIKTKVKVNQQKSVEELLIALKQFQREVQRMKAYRTSLQKEIEWIQSDAYEPGKPCPFALEAPARPSDTPTTTTTTTAPPHSAPVEMPSSMSEGEAIGEEKQGESTPPQAEAVVMTGGEEGQDDDEEPSQEHARTDLEPAPTPHTPTPTPTTDATGLPVVEQALAIESQTGETEGDEAESEGDGPPLPPPVPRVECPGGVVAPHIVPPDEGLDLNTLTSIDEVRTLLAELRARCKDEMKSLRQATAGMSQANDEKETELDALRERAEEASEMYAAVASELKPQFDEIEERRKKIQFERAQHQAQLDSLDSELAALRQRNADLNQQLAELHEAQEALQEDMDDNARTLAAQKEELSSVRAQNAAAQIRAEEMRPQVAKLQQDFDEARARFETAEKENKDIQDTVQSLQAEVEAVQEEEATMRAELEENNAEIAELEELVQQTQSLHEENQQQLTSAQDDTDHQAELAALEEEMVLMRTELAELGERRTQLQQECSQIEQEVEERQKHLERADERNEELTAFVESLQRVRDALDSEDPEEAITIIRTEQDSVVERVTASIESGEDEFAETIEQLEAENSEMVAKLEEQTALRDQIRAKLDEQAEKDKVLLGPEESALQEAQRRVQQVQDELAQLAKQREETRAQMRKIKDETEKASREVKQLETKIAQDTTRLQTCEAKTAQIREETTDLEAKIHDLQAKKSDLEAQFESTATEGAEHCTEELVHDLETQVKEVKSRLANLTVETRRSKEQISVAEREADLACHLADQRRDETNKRVQRIEDLDREIERLRLHNERLERESNEKQRQLDEGQARLETRLKEQAEKIEAQRTGKRRRPLPETQETQAEEFGQHLLKKVERVVTQRPKIEEPQPEWILKRNELLRKTGRTFS
eukprot:gnl/Trimastix_PCT/1909.p1 GENE.gnl/Trimastix_PCT/1909~~gnl/Trimastix_PCT/1909.p1  ORF type:complete len:1223 (+),score=352.48 gnl/Trimastix_PCT/1909:110-3778(+)